MTQQPCWHPDLLRRFVPTPYVFSKCDGPNRLSIESNDLEIALSVRQAGVVQRQGTRAGRLLCKIIRDMAGPVDTSEITIIFDGVLRVLYLGRGTILIHDHERSELLGFIARNVTVQELVSSLIPALIDAKSPQDVDPVAFTKK
jgi:hypothetical protein